MLTSHKWGSVALPENNFTVSAQATILRSPVTGLLRYPEDYCPEAEPDQFSFLIVGPFPNDKTGKTSNPIMFSMMLLSGRGQVYFLCIITSWK